MVVFSAANVTEMRGQLTGMDSFFVGRVMVENIEWTVFFVGRVIVENIESRTDIENSIFWL